MQDLYEFPADYTGRKTYVHVEGHKRSIPVIYTYKGTDRRNHVLPEFGGTDKFFANGRGPMILSDMTPYRSPLDGEMVTSRSSHRDHMRKHDVIEVGNEKLPTPADRAPMPRAGHDIKRAMHELGAK